MAVESPLPPSGFLIKSEAEIARAQEDDFESKHPELALWIKIKNALLASDGEHYFESELKDSAVPQLQGVLVEARPECRPTELRISIRLPKDTQSPSPEVLLKLDKSLTGKPELSKEVHWTGVATSFSKEPFLLTMATELSQIEGLSLSPCLPNPKKKTVPTGSGIVQGAIRKRRQRRKLEPISGTLRRCCHLVVCQTWTLSHIIGSHIGRNLNFLEHRFWPMYEWPNDPARSADYTSPRPMLNGKSAPSCSSRCTATMRLPLRRTANRANSRGSRR